ncbi:radical SAM family heme chaperone HemW [Shimia sp. SDUM112013]|uniref:radical SAM family heme chaperone HemW n=1 Tax=Shimia sp. SDUM112013 TaxID=3136160 RepID=UPI0032F03971
MVEDWQNGGFGLYIHWPFCQAKCPYCDFNSHVAREIDQIKWLKAYLVELDRVAAEVPGRTLKTVFFGGGTPSLMDPMVVSTILEKVRSLWSVANDLEVTLEANPGSVEAKRFEGYRDGGVNRISMGIQSLNNYDLQKLGRIHTFEEAIAAFDIARQTFERVSFDLIYARQNQTLEAWENELRQALSMAIDHLSLYQLTIEENTAFGDRYDRGKLRGLPDDDLAAQMYEATAAICQDHGFENYEVSNYAKKGFESRHNQIYWRYGDYAGIGPGAHGRLTINGEKLATECWRNPERWLQEVLSGSGESARVVVNQVEQSVEFLLMGLRLSEGVDLLRYENLSGRPLNQEKVNALREMNMISVENHRLTVLPQGRILLNSVLSELLTV